MYTRGQSQGQISGNPINNKLSYTETIKTTMSEHIHHMGSDR